MLFIGPAAWLLGMGALIARPGFEHSRVIFGLTLGAFLGVLLIAAPATGTAAAGALSTDSQRSAFESYMGGQLVWLGAVGVGAVGYVLSRAARGLPRTPPIQATECLALAATSAVVLASTYSQAWLVPLAPLAAGALAARFVGRGRGAWPAAAGSTVAFGLSFAAVDPLALIPALAALAVGILGTSYAIGRWTDLHEEANAPPGLLVYGSIAAGFVLVYWRPGV